ncbi:hypothetical protein HQ520_16290 [bacterium]|nr:hypothetical protein [bacterium]
MGAPFGELGPANCEWNSVDLGDNHSVTSRHSEDTAEHKTAQNGTSPKDEIFTGEATEIEISMTGSTLTQLAAALPGTTKTGDELMFSSQVGTSMRDNAQQLVIKPIINGTATVDATKWITFFLTYPKLDSEIVFDAETDREYKVLFKAFKVDATASGETYAVGDIWAIGYGETS